MYLQQRRMRDCVQAKGKGKLFVKSIRDTCGTSPAKAGQLLSNLFADSWGQNSMYPVSQVVVRAGGKRDAISPQILLTSSTNSSHLEVQSSQFGTASEHASTQKPMLVGENSQKEKIIEEEEPVVNTSANESKPVSVPAPASAPLTETEETGDKDAELSVQGGMGPMSACTKAIRIRNVKRRIRNGEKFI